MRYKTIAWFLALLLTSSFLSCSCEDTKVDEPKSPWKERTSTNFGRQPSWSPDGTLILFGDDRPSQAGLYVWDMTSAPRLLANDLPPHNWDYSWSHDSKRVAFSSPGEAGVGSTGLWIANVVDTSATKIWDRGTTPSWVAGDSAILFRMDNPGGVGTAGIYSITTSTNTARPLLTGGYIPVASPTDGRFLFIDNEINGTLYLQYADGATNLIGGQGVRKCAWTIDGQKAYAQLNRLADIGTGTGVLVRIPMNTFVFDTIMTHCTQPSIDKDGNVLAYMGELSGLYNGLWARDNSGATFRLSDSATQPSVAPNGTAISAQKSGGGIIVWAL